MEEVQPAAKKRKGSPSGSGGSSASGSASPSSSSSSSEEGAGGAAWEEDAVSPEAAERCAQLAALAAAGAPQAAVEALLEAPGPRAPLRSCPDHPWTPLHLAAMRYDPPSFFFSFPLF